MRHAIKYDQLMKARCGLRQALGMGQRQDFIIAAVQNQQRKVQPAHARRVVPRIGQQPGQPRRDPASLDRCRARGTEAGSDDHPVRYWPEFPCHVQQYAGTERVPKHVTPRCVRRGSKKHLVGRACVFTQTPYRRTSVACAIAAVIEHEGADARMRQHGLHRRQSGRHSSSPWYTISAGAGMLAAGAYAAWSTRSPLRKVLWRSEASASSVPGGWPA